MLRDLGASVVKTRVRALATPLLCGLLACAVAGAQTSCSSPRPPAQKLPLELLQKARARRSKEAPTTTSLVGVVTGPDGKPVDFALVAAVPVNDDPEDAAPPFVATSIDRGKFEITGLPPGRYGITVTAPAANAVPTPPSDEALSAVPTGTFAGVVTATAGEPGPPVVLRLGGEGIVLSGRVTDQKGNPLSMALLRAVRESPFEGDTFFAKTTADGAFVLALPPARYYLVAQAPDRRPVRLDVSTDRIQKDLVLRLPPALVPPPPADLAAWVASSGAVLGAAEGEGTVDLARLKDIVGTARVVGLGEASYTGSELAKIRLRMFRYLATEMGFSTLLVEATQADVRPLNEYLLSGTGSLPELVAGLGYFCLDTEETIALFTWMRKYNQEHFKQRKLRVKGIDVQRTAAAATDLDAYLRKVDKVFAATMESTLYRLRTNEFGTAFRDRPADEQEAVIRDLDSIVGALDTRRRVYTAKARHAEWEKASDDAAALRWAIRVYRDERQRAPALADMARRAIASEPPGVKVAIWAHNTQISRRPDDAGMGALLAAAYRGDYVPIGSTFYQGWIRAWDYTQGFTTDRGTKLFRLAPAAPGTLEAFLEAAGHPLYYADLRKAPPSVAAWLDARLPMRSAGTVFVNERQARTRTVPREAFDALVFVHKLTTVKFTETGKRPARKDSD